MREYARFPDRNGNCIGRTEKGGPTMYSQLVGHLRSLGHGVFTEVAIQNKIRELKARNRLAHMETGEAEMQQYYCELCDIHFATAQALGGHVGNNKMHARLKEEKSTSENTKLTASRLRIRGQAQPAGVAATGMGRSTVKIKPFLDAYNKYTTSERRRFQKEEGLPNKEALARAVAGWKSLSKAERQNW